MNKSLFTPCIHLVAVCMSLASGLAEAQTPGGSRTEIRSTATQIAAGIAAAEAALGPAALAIAQQVHTGVLPCELGASVTVASDPLAPGYFNMHGRNFRYRMAPVVTSTGAVRLEDRKAGAVWLQLSNKSMLMNQKAGKRVADDCKSPAQLTVAQAMKDQPPPGLLDAPSDASAMRADKVATP
jgi:hypothetical protein